MLTLRPVKILLSFKNECCSLAFSVKKNISRMAIKAVLIDLSGTLHIEDDPTPNAVEALEKLRETKLQIKFVTNTTKESKETLHKRLTKIGFNIAKDEIFSSLSAAVVYVQENKLNPFYLLSDDARQDFPIGGDGDNFDSVVVGLDAFNYEKLNKAFNILLNNHPLIAIHQGKYYKRSDGLALGPGCFVKGLEYAASCEATVIGKPNKYFFESAIPAGIKPAECVMIGDDANDDIVGAMNIGMKGILVKTGKYLPEAAEKIKPTSLQDNFSEAVKYIINSINN